MAHATADRERELLLPNLLSFSRIPLAGLLWVAPFEPAWTLPVLAVAGITDVLDGWLARRARRRRAAMHDPGAWAAHETRGAFIDGLADKVFVVSTVGVLAYTIGPAWWLLVVLAMREVLFVPLMLAYRAAPPKLRQRVDFTAGFPGTAATLAQFSAVVLGLLRSPHFDRAAIVAGFLGAAATLVYVTRVFEEPR